MLSSPVRMYRKAISLTPSPFVGGGVGVGVSEIVKFFMVTGKALTGELSCWGTGVVIYTLVIKKLHVNLRPSDGRNVEVLWQALISFGCLQT